MVFYRDFIWNSELNYYCNGKIVKREWKLSLEKMLNSYELGVLNFKNDGTFTFKKIKQGNPKEIPNIAKYYEKISRHNEGKGEWEFEATGHISLKFKNGEIIYLYNSFLSKDNLILENSPDLFLDCPELNKN